MTIQPAVRLYYHDATLREFAATITATDRARANTLAPEALAAVRVRLNQTAFYPTSGGQPHDTGTLNGVPVVDVLEDDEGAIWHVLAEPLIPGTERVRGQIDWERRFDHMQQHTAQHMLSAAFEDMRSAPTIGFHLGSEASTIDLELRSGIDLDWGDMLKVETAVNQVIWENRPVTVRIIGEEELAEIALRKPPAVRGQIRVIQVAGYDASACGGTHVAATGEIGIVKVIGFERYKGGIRVTFLAGQRALHHYQHHLHLLQTSSLALSVGPEELPQAIARIEESAKEVRRDLRQVREALLAYEADRLWAEASVIANVRVIAATLTERTLAEARALAGSLRERPATLILFAIAEDEAARLVCARSDDLDTLNAAQLLRDVLTATGGRGGGSSTMAQGGAPAQSPERLDEALQSTLKDYGLAR